MDNFDYKLNNMKNSVDDIMNECDKIKHVYSKFKS